MEKRLGIRHAGLYKRVAKSVEKKGVAMDRFSKFFGKSAEKKAEQKVSMQLRKQQKAPDANANGTSGYLLKSGKNSGKILKHLKTDKNQL
jgi:hypothetical protein